MLKLIDYDAMYVPALKGLKCHETGHRNYQHPGRTGENFHPALDNFSAWVIFTSIAALAAEPRLWNSLDAGDECLLFRPADFENPRSSTTLRAFEGSSNGQLRALALRFRSLLALPGSSMPFLDHSAMAGLADAASFTKTATTEALPDWISGYLEADGQAPNERAVDLPVNPAETLKTDAESEQVVDAVHDPRPFWKDPIFVTTAP